MGVIPHPSRHLLIQIDCDLLQNCVIHPYFLTIACRLVITIVTVLIVKQGDKTHSAVVDIRIILSNLHDNRRHRVRLTWLTQH